ncbi:MAG: cytochrome c biogenesis protein ResB [Candidatus Aminicenantes bacterium]|nr:cytochrome c biogenesis protein ResB [Candidatus Aminicenantes bacterium]
MNRLVRFLSSVRLAITLFILVTIASILGTLLPRFYLYRTPAYLALLLLFALSIMACALTRSLPRLRRTLKPSWDWTAESLAAEPESRTAGTGVGLEAASGALRAALSGRRYRIREERRDEVVLLAARRRTWGGFGADVVHAGLLVILAGAILSGVAGWRTDLSLVPGGSADVPSAGFQVRLEAFRTETYPDGAVKDWKSRLTVLDGGAPVRTETIEVNHPLRYKGVRIYQSGYGWNWEEAALVLRVRKRDDPSSERLLEVRTGGEARIPGTELTVAAARFVPDFVINARNEVGTRSLEPNNPAVLIEAEKGGRTVLSAWLFANHPEFDRIRERVETGLAFELLEVRADPLSILQAAFDPGAPFIWFGCAVLMFGLGLAFYWPSREIRAAVTARRGRTEAVLSGRAPKAREALTKDIAAAAEAVAQERS